MNHEGQHAMELKAIRLNTLVTVLSILAFLGGAATVLVKTASISSAAMKQIEVNTPRISALEASMVTLRDTVNTLALSITQHVAADTRDGASLDSRVAKTERDIIYLSDQMQAIRQDQGKLLQGQADLMNRLDEHSRMTRDMLRARKDP
jgi:hypothetical protein